MEASILTRLEAVKDLPTIPLVIRKIEEIVQDPNASAKQVARVIEDDPAIMTRILKVVNSVFYRGADGREISSLPLAIARLGFTTIKNIALTTSVFSMFGDTNPALFDRNKFWVHCIATGIINNIIYETCGGNLSRLYSKDELHLLGLLHDVGKIILEQYFHDEFSLVLDTAREKNLHSVAAEEEVLGANHAQIGAWLAKKWMLPPLFVNGILFHHRPEAAPDEFRDAVVMTNIADFICIKGQIGNSGTTVLPKFDGGVWKHLGLNNKLLAEILDRANEETKNSSIMLAIAA